MKAGKLRWKVWAKVSKRPNVCPANAHSRIIWGYRDTSIGIGRYCREDLAQNGICWCGKLRADGAPA